MFVFAAEVEETREWMCNRHAESVSGGRLPLVEEDLIDSGRGGERPADLSARVFT